MEGVLGARAALMGRNILCTVSLVGSILRNQSVTCFPPFTTASISARRSHRPIIPVRLGETGGASGFRGDSKDPLIFTAMSGVVCQAIDFDSAATAQNIFAHLPGLEKLCHREPIIWDTVIIDLS
jgi:hypothetical protein